MNTVTAKLQDSRAHLGREARVFVSSTRRAGAAFAVDTQHATSQLAGVAREEVGQWTAYVASQLRALRPPELPKPDLGKLEHELWSGVLHVLDLAHGRVARRLAQLGDGEVLPLAEYDTLSARAIVSKLDALSSAECATVLAFEQSHKKRATVLRALEHKLAA